MFKNLDGFKKIKQDDSTATMQHPKGHTITIAMRALPAIHRRQLMALPIHEACGGPIKMADGGPPIPTALPSPDPNYVAPQQSNEEVDPNADARGAAQMASLQQGKVLEDQPDTSSAGASGSWDDQSPEVAPAVSSAQPAAQTQQSAQGGGLSPMSAYGMQSSGLKEQARAEKSQAGEERIASEEYQNSLADSAAKWQNTQADMMGQIKGALNDMANGQINPKHYQESMTSGQKATAAIGLFLGGLSTPYTHQGNPALDMLNKQIDRDIDAQKVGLNNKQNIYHAYLDQYKNAAAAESMTRATMLGIYGQKMKMAALNNADPLIQARLKMGLGQLQQSIIPQVLNAQLMNEGSKFNGSRPDLAGSESDYQMYLRGAQAINPTIYKDAQEKYIPGVGTTAIPVKHEDIGALSTLKNLNQSAKEAQDFAQTNGRTMWGTDANQKANDIANNLRLQIGQLVNLKRINEYEAKKYDDLIRSPGSWNQGAAIQSFKDFRNDIHSKTKSMFDQYQVKPFRK